MTFMYIPEIEHIVLESCKDLIDEFHFRVQKLSKNHIHLFSTKCAINISAGISPIGEDELNIDFFDPADPIDKRIYFSDVFLLYVNTRREPRDVMDHCLQKETERERTFDKTIRIALTCFTLHTLKYRRDILNGDFTSWLPKPMS
jgi:hypothetical protein